MKNMFGRPVFKAGLVEGGGTGPELAEVFERAVERIAKSRGLSPDIRRFGYRPKTFHEISKMGLSPEETRELEKRESRDLEAFYREAFQDGYRAIFRTAINAGTLYRLRNRTGFASVMPIQRLSRRILLVRDELQGFYSLDSREEEDDRIAWSESLTRENTERMMSFAESMVTPDLYGARHPNDVRRLMIYKYHLFTNLERWVSEFNERLEVPFELRQPGSGIPELLNPRRYDDIVALASNEVGDILADILPSYHGAGPSRTMHKRNIALYPPLEGLEVYQTVHGSADDIAGQGIVNPAATLRATADLLERQDKHFYYDSMHRTIRDAEKEGYLTPDLAGSRRTMEVVDFVLDHLGA